MFSSEPLPSLLKKPNYGTCELTSQLGNQKVFLFLYLVFSVEKTNAELALWEQSHMCDERTVLTVDDCDA